MDKMRNWNLKGLLYALLFLCFADAAFTDFGLRMKLIEELNPLVKGIYDWHIAAFYALKLLLPLLLIIIYRRLKRRVWINPFMILALVLYFVVNVYHLVWIYLGLESGQLSFSLL